MTRRQTSSTERVLARPPAKIRAPATQLYRIRKSFAVVHFDAGGQGRIVFLPAGSELLIMGPSALCECFEVLCEQHRYNIFKEDLLGPWANPIEAGSNRPHLSSVRDGLGV